MRTAHDITTQTPGKIQTQMPPENQVARSRKSEIRNPQSETRNSEFRNTTLASCRVCANYQDNGGICDGVDGPDGYKETCFTPPENRNGQFHPETGEEM